MMIMKSSIGRWIPALTLVLTVNAASAQLSSRQISSRLERGYQLLKENKKPEAMAAFNSVIKNDPSNHAALIELGYLHAGMKHWRSAAKYLQAASAQDPENKRLHMDLGYAYQSIKDLNRAENEFQTVAKEPGEFQTQAQSALTAIANGRQSGVDSKQSRLLEEGYAALNKEDKALARQRFEAALAQDPQNTVVLKQLGFLDLSQGKTASAAKRFEAVRAIDSNDYFASLQLGYIYQRQRKIQRAQEAFNSAVASPDAQIHGAAQAALVSMGPTTDVSRPTGLQSE